MIRPSSPLTMLLSRHTRRREFITLLGGAAAAWPLAARAQQPTMPVIGFLDTALGRRRRTQQVAAFRKGLREAGYVEGQNVAIEFRWAEGQYERLAELVADLVRRQVERDRHAGQRLLRSRPRPATTTIPIVFACGWRPGQERSGRQPRTARRQRHWCQLLYRGSSGQAHAAAARVGPGGETDRCAGQSHRSGAAIGRYATYRQPSPWEQIILAREVASGRDIDLRLREHGG